MREGSVSVGASDFHVVEAGGGAAQRAVADSAIGQVGRCPVAGPLDRRCVIGVGGLPDDAAEREGAGRQLVDEGSLVGQCGVAWTPPGRAANPGPCDGSPRCRPSTSPSIAGSPPTAVNSHHTSYTVDWTVSSHSRREPPTSESPLNRRSMNCLSQGHLRNKTLFWPRKQASGTYAPLFRTICPGQAH